MALDQPRSAVPPKAHSEVVKSELRKIDDEEVYDSLCKWLQSRARNFPPKNRQKVGNLP